MDSEIVDVVTDWESESYTGGYDGLRDLADGEFTGAVTEGSAWLFFLNGRIVGAFDGGVGAFEATDGTAFRAPDPSLPLLFTMLATGGETKAQYYTEDTSLSSADDTLSAGNFTGYVELSENVFSGDYYVVYYGGRKLPCAFVGQSRDLLTGDEAFSRAADETGIYEVMDVDVEITQLPEPDEPDEPEATDPPEGGTDTTGAGTAPEATEPDADDGAEPSPGDAAPDPTETASATGSDDPPTATDGAAPRSPGGPTETDAPTDGGATAAPSAPAREATPEPEPEPEPEPAASPSGPEPATEPTRSTTESAATEREWQETRTIPSLDPSESSTDGKPSGDTGTGPRDTSASADSDATSDTRERAAEGRGGTQSQRRGQAGATGRQATRARGQRREEGRSTGGGRSTTDEQTVALRERVTELESERDDARERLQETESELEETEATVSRLREDNERLESRVEELESELADARERLREFEAERPDGDTEVTPAAALSGTNLFVRYDSKSDPTLENAHDETATRTEVEENLRVETHTDFESDDAVVAGESYDEFLTGTVEYSFVDWVIRELLYELQETGAEGKLRDLYDAIPKVDRAELHGAVELVGEDQKVEGERPFDVILRDRMGDPLVVANVTDAREATAEPEVTELISDAREVAESRDSLGAAVYVSASFFEPRALEAVTAETGGGLLSRNKRASYVKLARKRGFHLGLVESREEGFHFTVPEL